MTTSSSTSGKKFAFAIALLGTALLSAGVLYAVSIAFHFPSCPVGLRGLLAASGLTASIGFFMRELWAWRRR